MCSGVSLSNGERRRRKCNFWHFPVLYVDDDLLYNSRFLDVKSLVEHDGGV